VARVNKAGRLGPQGDHAQITMTHRTTCEWVTAQVGMIVIMYPTGFLHTCSQIIRSIVYITIPVFVQSKVVSRAVEKQRNRSSERNHPGAAR
jgi:hypothetical protein